MLLESTISVSLENMMTLFVKQRQTRQRFTWPEYMVSVLRKTISCLQEVLVENSKAEVSCLVTR